MFDKFGEFDSAEELNKTAEGLKAEKDRESLLLLAAENGIDQEDAEDYWNGYMVELAGLASAASGRLKIEKENSAIPKQAREVIYGMAAAMCMGDKTVQELVMRKGARIDNIWNHMKDLAKQNKTGNMGVACGTDADLRRMIISALKEGAADEKA